MKFKALTGARFEINTQHHQIDPSGFPVSYF